MDGYYTDEDCNVYETVESVVDYLFRDTEPMSYERRAVGAMVERLWGDPSLSLSLATGLTWHESRCWTDGTTLWSTDYELKARLWRRLMARDRKLCDAIKEWMVRRNMTVLDALFTNAVAVFEGWFDKAIDDEAYMKEWLGIERCGPANGFEESMEG